MKKQLQLITLFFALLTLTSQAQKGAALLTNPSDIFTTKKAGGKGTQASITTTVPGTCMSINYPAPATWSLVNYGTGTVSFASDGFVNGKNVYGDKEKAMYFDASATANTLLTQLYIGFDHAYTSTPSKTVGIKIYDGTTGTPAATLGTATISMSTIMTDVSNNQYSLLIFGTPISLPASKKFFVSVDVTGLAWTAGTKDSLSIVSNSDPQTVPCATWEKWSTNTWYRYDNINSWGINISLLIHPFLRSAPMTASMTATPSNTICSGQTINYNSAGSSAGTYEWYFGAIPTGSATGATTMAAYPTAGTYTTYLIAEDACGSLAITSKTITVNPSPTVTATPNSTTVCSGSNVTLNGGGASSYAWSGGISNNVAFTPSATANYTVVGTAANSCTAMAIAAVVVNPNPTITVNSGSICSGQSFTMSPSGASTYTFSSGSSVVSPTANASYSVTGTSAAGCISAAAAVSDVTVNTTPTASATSGGSITCTMPNQSLTGSGVTTYTWTGPGIVSGGNTANPTVNAGGTYSLVGSSSGCVSNTATITVFTNTTAPSLSVSATPTAICAGDSTTLMVTGAFTYSWSTGATTPAINVMPSSNAVYTVTGVDITNGCSSTITQPVTVNSLPVITAASASSVICGPPYQQTVTITANGASTYTWNTSASGASISVSPSVTTQYTVTGTDSNGCMNMTTITQSVSACTGISTTLNNQSDLVIYPNPSNGNFTVGGLVKGMSVEIYNNIGQLILKQEAVESSVNINGLASGLYIVTVTEKGNQVMVKKLVCQ